MKSNNEPRMTLLFMGLAIILLAVSPLPRADSFAQSILDARVIEQSSFIFQGTIIKLKAVTLPIVPASENTIVVKVDEIIEAPKLLGDFTGQEITVLVRDPPTLRVGARGIFFARGWLLGEGIAVQEVGRFMDLRTEIIAARQTLADQTMEKRLASADLVVVGKVAEIKPVAEPGPSRPITEHDPQWQEAVVEIETVLKGDVALKRIVLWFPGSLDVAWVNVPRFKVDQEGIWILRHVLRDLLGQQHPNYRKFSQRCELPAERQLHHQHAPQCR